MMLMPRACSSLCGCRYIKRRGREREVERGIANLELGNSIVVTVRHWRISGILTKPKQRLYVLFPILLMK